MITHPVSIGNIDSDPRNWNWLRYAPGVNDTGDDANSDASWEPVSFAQKTAAGKIKIRITDLIKVGPEGYIHGYICVRPPCGKYSEAQRESHGGRTVTPDGAIIGRDLKKEAGDHGYSIKYQPVSGKSGVKLAGQYATRQDGSKAVVALHNIDVLRARAIPDETEAAFSQARDAIINGHHDEAMMHLAEAETTASMRGDAATASHAFDIRSALNTAPHPLDSGEPLPPVTLPEPLLPEPPVKKIPEDALEEARQHLTHASVWYHPTGDVATKLVLAENAMHQGGVERAVKHLADAHSLAVAAGQDRLAQDIQRAHAAVAPHVGTDLLPDTSVPAKRSPALARTSPVITRKDDGAITRTEARDASGKLLGYTRIYGGHDGDDKPVLVQTLNVGEDARGHGIGSALMQDAVDQYGHREMKIRPTPFGDKPMSKSDLESFYGKHGFAVASDDPGLMIRPPHGVAQPDVAPDDVKPAAPVRVTAGEIARAQEPERVLGSDVPAAEMSPDDLDALGSKMRSDLSYVPTDNEFAALSAVQRKNQARSDELHAQGVYYTDDEINATALATLYRSRVEEAEKRRNFAQATAAAERARGTSLDTRAFTGTMNDYLPASKAAAWRKLVNNKALKFSDAADGSSYGGDVANELDKLKYTAAQGMLEKAGLPRSAAEAIAAWPAADVPMDRVGMTEADGTDFPSMGRRMLNWVTSGDEASRVSSDYDEARAMTSPPEVRAGDFTRSKHTFTVAAGKPNEFSFQGWEFDDNSPEAAARRRAAAVYWGVRAQQHYTHQVLRELAKKPQPDSMPVTRMVHSTQASALRDAEKRGEDWVAATRSLSSWAEPSERAKKSISKFILQDVGGKNPVWIRQEISPDQVFAHWRGEGSLRNGVKALGEVITADSGTTSANASLSDT